MRFYGYKTYADGVEGRQIVLLLSIIFCFCSPHLLQAQACTTGNEPIVSLQTFGSGSSGPLPTGQLEYRYVADGCPNDGQYTITDSVSGTCYTSSWHSLPQDHTPNDSRGNMLVVNAPYPGTFYRQSISGLCSGTTYEFSMWLVNLNVTMPAGTCGFAVPQDPNMTIRAETVGGTLIDSIRTGNLTRTISPVWRRLSLLFTVPVGAADTTTVVLRFVNNEGGGCGNDFALDDLMLKQCSDCRFSPIFIPEVFTPNGDGVNDVLTVFYQLPLSFELTIFNRWGAAIFVSHDSGNQWNGMYGDEPCKEGVYAWVLTYELVNSTGQATTFRKTGQVLLVR